MLIHLIKNAVLWMNTLPAQDGISTGHSPQYIMTGWELEWKKHPVMELGAYAQCHEEHTNEMVARTIGDRIPSTTPGAEPPRDAKDSGSARSHSTHLETSSSDRP